MTFHIFMDAHFNYKQGMAFLVRDFKFNIIGESPDIGAVTLKFEEGQDIEEIKKSPHVWMVLPPILEYS